MTGTNNGVFALRRCWTDIVDDLDVLDVLTDLISKFILDYDDKEHIDKEGTTKKKADKLLQILEGKATSNPQIQVVPEFANSLKQKYPWLHSKLTEDFPDSSSGGSGVLPLPPGSPYSRGDRGRYVSGGGENGKYHGESSTEDKRLKMILEGGGVQRLPPITIQRQDLLHQIRTALHEMTDGIFVVLHGMAGSGKSVLATQAINDPDLVNQCFSNGIYWLSIGKECSESKDAILAKIRTLCEKLGESRNPNSFDHGADLLKTALMKQPETLLVLDDVWKPEVIRAFDIGCRIMVTTRDFSVSKNVDGRCVHINVEDGFSEEESLSLFSRSLKIDITNLPLQAKQIHHECKGSPMVISLIASLLQDHDFWDVGRWQYYLESLMDRKYAKVGPIRAYQYDSILDAISLSFAALPEDKQDLYLDFGLFQGKVGIPHCVLMTLWKMQKYEVEDIMKIFVHKSLATEEYNPVRKSYVYSVHDLLSDFLKIKLKGDSETVRHQKLIERYLDSCGGEISRLSDDGYIYFHLGYHLYKSKLHEKFPKIYFDLKFIGEKLRITGPADLLLDLKLYRDYIARNDEEQVKKVEELQVFAQHVGPRIYGQIDVDIIQIALQTPHLSWMYEEAKLLANMDGNRLFLEWKNADQGKHPESTVICGDHVYCLKFVGSIGSHFLAGLTNGSIVLCDLESSTICRTFQGHSETVKSLNIFSPKRRVNGDCDPDSEASSPIWLVSASADATCKLWDLKPALDELELNSLSGTVVNMRDSPSPKSRSEYWMFDDSFKTFERHTGPVNYAEFSTDGSFIVSASVNEIMVWKSESTEVLSKISPAFDSHQDLSFRKCLCPPNPNAKYLVCSASNQLILLSRERASIYSSVEAHAVPIVDIQFVKGNTVISISDNEVALWKIEEMSFEDNAKRKSFRSRSLSPSRITGPFFQNTGANVIVRGNTLNPGDIQVPWAVNGNGQGQVVKSTSGHTALNGSSGLTRTRTPSICASIDVDNYVIEVVKENVWKSRSSGILLCSAVSKEDESGALLLACGTSDYKIFLWKIGESTISCLGSFTSNSRWVTCLDFSPIDPNAILSGSENEAVTAWDIEEEQKGQTRSQKSLNFSSEFIYSEQAYFITSFYTERNTVQVYKDFDFLCESSPFPHAVTSTCVSGSGDSVAVGLDNGELWLWRVNCGAELQSLSTLDSKITSLDFGCEDKFLIAGSASGAFTIFEDFMDLHGGTLSTDAPYLRSFFRFNNNYVIGIAEDSHVMMLDLSCQRGPRSWNSGLIDVHVTCCDCTPDGRLLTLGTSSDGILFLKLSPNLTLQEISVHPQLPLTSSVKSIALSSSSTNLMVAVGCENGIVYVWNVEDDRIVEERKLILHKMAVRALQFSPSSIGKSHWLITTGDGLAVWNLDKYEAKSEKRTSWLEERRRRRSGESPARSQRLSLEVPVGTKIGKKGKRELLQHFAFRGNYAQHFVTDPWCDKILSVDDTGIFYFLETLKIGDSHQVSSSNHNHH